MTDYRKLSTDQLSDEIAFLKKDISRLEKRKVFLSVQEASLLKSHRAALRAAKKEQKRRVYQLPLLL